MGRVARLAVRQNGVEKTFLKVEEAARGGLTVTSDVPNPPMSPETVDIYWSDKLSVHLSERSEGAFRTLHVTQIVLGECTEITARLPIVAGKPFIYPVVARMVHKLVRAEHDLARKKEDEAIPLAGYHTSAATLLLCCFVTDPDVKLPTISGFRKAVARFSVFNLVFYYAYAGVESPNLPVQINVSTAPLKVNGVEVSGRYMNTQPLELGEVPGYVVHQATGLIDIFMASAETYHKTTGTPLPYPPARAWPTPPYPQPFDEEDIRYGIHAPLILDDAERFLNQYGENLAYNDVTENGTAEEHLAYIENAICWGGLIDRAELDRAAGGDLLAYLRAAIARGVAPTL